MAQSEKNLPASASQAPRLKVYASATTCFVFEHVHMCTRVFVHVSEGACGGQGGCQSFWDYRQSGAA